MIAPFRAIPGPTGEALGFNYALPVDLPDDEMTLRSAIRRLQSRYRQGHYPLRIEFNEELWPGLGRTLEHEGFTLESRNPLMTCTRDRFTGVTTSGVAVRFLATDPRHPSTHRVAGEIDGIAVGQASLGAIEGVAELYGVITEPAYRRRGVAATLCSALIDRHFVDGGTLVFLDAENDAAVALYRRLGFRQIGSRVTYTAPE